MWDTTSGTEIQQFLGHTGGVTAVAYSRCGKYLATASNDKYEGVWAMAGRRAS